MSRVIKHFDILTEHGLKIIPLRPLTKIPISKGWTDWNRDQARYILERVPNANIGLLLGDIIDVEGDSKEANDKIIDLIGDYNHPTYASTKSIHHLFINPEPNLTVIKYKQMEFRANRHQSVLPPSTLENGVNYNWLTKLTFPIPPMPDRLLGFFRSLKIDYKNKTKPGHMKITCFQCREKKYIHQKRFQLELIAFNKIKLHWLCHNCRKVDLRETCRLIRKLNK